MHRALPLTLATLCAAGLALAGCSSDSSSSADAGPPGNPGTVNTQSAKQSSTTMVSGISTAVDGNKGQESLGLLISGAQQARGIVTPSASAGGAPGVTPQTLDTLDLIGVVSQAITSCDGACTGTTCEFKGCGTEGAGAAGSVTINGTLSWAGGNLKCVGLTYDIASTLQTTKLTLNCDVTASGGAIKGTIKSSGNVSVSLGDAGAGAGALGNVSWTADTTFNDLKYASGKPSSGSVKVVATTTVAGQTYNGTADVSFP